VRAAFLAAPPGSPLRAELLGWIRSGLLAAVQVVVADAALSAPEPVQAQTPGGLVEVGHSGVTPEQRQRAETRVHERYAPPPRWTFVTPAVVAVVLLVVSVLAGALGRTDLALLTVLGTLIAVGVVLRELVVERRRRQQLQSDLEATRTSLDQAELRAAQLEAARREIIQDTHRLAAALRGRLGASVAD